MDHTIDWQTAIIIIGCSIGIMLTLLIATWFLSSKFTKMSLKVDYLSDAILQMHADKKIAHDEFWREHRETDEEFKAVHRELGNHSVKMENHENRIRLVENKVHRPPTPA